MAENTQVVYEVDDRMSAAVDKIRGTVERLRQANASTQKSVEGLQKALDGVGKSKAPQTLNKTLQSVKKLQKANGAAKKSVDTLGSSLNAVGKTQAPQVLTRLRQVIQQVTAASGQAGASMKAMGAPSGDGVSKMMDKLTSFIDLAKVAKKTWSLFVGGLTTAANQQQQRGAMQAALGDDNAGAMLYDYVGEYAQSKSALGRENLNKGVTSYLDFTHELDEIDKLVQLTERLYSKDPSQGANTAFEAVNQAMSGNTAALQEKFGIGGLSGEALQASLASGDTAGAITQIDEAMNRFGATQEAADRHSGNLLVQWERLTASLRDSFGTAMEGAYQRISLVVTKLSEMAAAGQLTPIIEGLAGVMGFLAEVIGFLVEKAQYIAPTIAGIVIALTFYKTAMGVASIATGIFGGTVAAAMPWLFAVGAILGLVASGAVKASGAFGSMSDKMKNVPEFDREALEKSLSDISAMPKVAMSEAALSNIPVQANITGQDSALKVTGEVDIEQENLRYLVDLAQRDVIRVFNNQIVPQATVNISTVNEASDYDTTVKRLATDLISEMSNRGEAVAFA